MAEEQKKLREMAIETAKQEEMSLGNGD